MYRPIVSYAPTGIMVDVEATVSADRRYVTVTAWGLQDTRLNNTIAPANGLAQVPGNLPNLAPPNVLTGGYNNFQEYSSNSLSLGGQAGGHWGRASFRLGSPYWGGCRRAYLPIWYGPTIVTYGDQNGFARRYGISAPQASTGIVQTPGREESVRHNRSSVLTEPSRTRKDDSLRTPNPVALEEYYRDAVATSEPAASKAAMELVRAALAGELKTRKTNFSEPIPYPDGD